MQGKGQYKNPYEDDGFDGWGNYGYDDGYYRSTYTGWSGTRRYDEWGRPDFKSPYGSYWKHRMEERSKFDVEDDRRFVVDASQPARERFQRRQAQTLGLVGRGETRSLKYVQELQLDLYEHFYRHSPQLREAQQVHPEFAPHIQILEAFKNSPGIAFMRKGTQGDHFSSTIALRSANAMLRHLSSHDAGAAIYRAQESGEMLRETKKKVVSLDQVYKAYKKAGKEKEARETADLIAELLEKQESQEAQMQSDLSGAQEALEGYLEESMGHWDGQIPNETQQMMDRAKGIAKAMGWDLSSSSAPLAVSQMSRQVRNISRFLRLLGMMKDAFGGRTTTQNQDFGEIVGATPGGDVGRLTATEMARLKHPRLRKDLLTRLIDRQAQVYERRSVVEEKGPVLVCVDTSGSMGGAPYDWAMGLMVIIFEECRRRRSPLKVISFASSTQTESFETHEEDRFYNFLGNECYLGGGTYYGAAFQAIAKELADDRAMRKADVVFISDECFPQELAHGLASRFRAQVEACNARVIGVNVAMTQGRYDADTSPFGAFCDVAWGISAEDLSADAEGSLEQLFSHLKG